MGEHLIVRSAHRADAAALADIHITSRAEAMPWLPVVHPPGDVLAHFRDVVLTRDTVSVADLSGEPAGFIAFTGDWVNHLYIAQAHWGQGLGSIPLDEAKAVSASLQLWTFQRNHRARAFYAKAGFDEVELTDGAGNEEKTPDVRLCWRRG